MKKSSSLHIDQHLVQKKQSHEATLQEKHSDNGTNDDPIMLQQYISPAGKQKLVMIVRQINHTDIVNRSDVFEMSVNMYNNN